MTNHVHRLLIIAPAARQVAVNAWIAANIDAVGSWLTATLNATGLKADAVTHYWCSAGLTDVQAKAFLVKICQLAVVALPTAAQWDSATQATKIAWLAGARAALVVGYGVYLNLSDNTGAWDNFQGIAAGLGLKPVDGLH